MVSYLSRASETIRTVDCRAKCQRGNRTYTWNSHQATADLLRTDNVENLLGQTGEFTQHRGEDRQQRFDERHYQGVGAGQFADAIGKVGSGRRPELNASFPQDRPHDVLDRAHLVENRAAGDQKRTPNPTLPAFDMHLPVPASPHDLRESPGI